MQETPYSLSLSCLFSLALNMPYHAIHFLYLSWVLHVSPQICKLHESRDGIFFVFLSSAVCLGLEQCLVHIKHKLIIVCLFSSTINLLHKWCLLLYVKQNQIQTFKCILFLHWKCLRIYYPIPRVRKQTFNNNKQRLW